MSQRNNGNASRDEERRSAVADRFWGKKDEAELQGRGIDPRKPFDSPRPAPKPKRG